MAREIKFRAWVNGFLPAQSGMFYGLDLYRNTISGGYDRIGVWRNNNRYHFKSEEEPFELMQYTGLKDKNGVEIYEGDIVSAYDWSDKCLTCDKKLYDEGNVTGEVTYQDGAYHIGGSNIWFTRNCEVIGNIYEEPR